MVPDFSKPMTSSGLTHVAVLITLCYLIGGVTSRARMIEPPMRSSYWRSGVPDAPVNFYDELLNCGGFEYQTNQANGQCGACGDRVGGFRENEYPGKYSQFPPQRTYRSGREINVTIYTSPNLLGFFVFRLCPFRDGPNLPDLEECFSSRSTLTVRETGSPRFYPGSKEGFHDLHLVIPRNLSCLHCILRWTYVTGYRQSADPQCQNCQGCGPQEQFVNCADIQILPEGMTWNTDMEGGGFESSNQQTPTTPPPFFSQSGPSPATSRPSDTPQASTTREVTTTSPQTGSTPGPSTSPAPCTPLANIVACKASGIQKLIPGMDTWCLRTCQSGRCSPQFCTCHCKYPGYQILIDPEAFRFAAMSKYSLSPSSTSPSQSTSSSKRLCYKATPLWSRTPGLNGWCEFNCPSEWCQDMCSLQVCP